MIVTIMAYGVTIWLQSIDTHTGDVFRRKQARINELRAISNDSLTEEEHMIIDERVKLNYPR